MHIPLYLPGHCSGGEWLARDVAEALTESGHHVTVLCHRSNVTEYEGIEILTEKGVGDATEDLYRKHDIVFTHLGTVGDAVNYCRKIGKPLVYYAHNDYRSSIVEAHPWIKVIYNSRWVAAALAYTNQSIVVPPILYYDKEYVPTNDGYFLMVNTNTNKGGDRLKWLAKNTTFNYVAVRGSYGMHVEQPKRVLTYGNNPDIQQLIAGCMALLVPSKYESWGRTAAEAMMYGKPVLCNHTPGLAESCDDAAWFLEDTNQIWMDAVTMINTQGNAYNYLVAASKARGEEIEESMPEWRTQIVDFITVIKS